MQQGYADGVKHARPTIRAVELHGVPEDNPAPAERNRQLAVWINAVGRRKTVRLGEDDVERHHRGSQRAEPIDQPTDHVAPPGPLPDRRQALFVDVNDHDLSARRSHGSRAHHEVVEGVVESGEGSRSRGRKDRHGQDRNSAAQQDKPAASANHRPDHGSPITSR